MGGGAGTVSGREEAREMTRGSEGRRARGKPGMRWVVERVVERKRILEVSQSGTGVWEGERRRRLKREMLVERVRYAAWDWPWPVS